MHKDPLKSTDIQALRRDARKHLNHGAVTTDYKVDRTDLLARINGALATELVCVLRYRRHHFMARGIDSCHVAAEFLIHANQELGHADILAARIVQLGGEPDFSPQDLASRSHAEYLACRNLQEMISENLIAERIAIQSYRELIQSLGDKDSTTSDILKRILAVEEEHADELASMLDNMPQE